MERVTENLKILNQPACYATGVRRFERARVQELADQGRSAEEISHIMRVQLSAIEALLTELVSGYKPSSENDDASETDSGFRSAQERRHYH